jgi:hypothetical protein
MSIAEEESTRKYYLLEGPEHGEGLREKLLDAALENRHVIAQREAYVAGRTAELTEAEIEAAARVFFGNLHYPSASLDWDKAADCVKDNWRLKTRLALAAARKAVAE